MGKFGKTLDSIKAETLKSWKKLVQPTVSRGQTAFPRALKDQQRLGTRFDYDGEIDRSGIVCHKYQLQANAGKVPTSIEKWRKANGGTHAVMATIYIPKDGTQEDVAAGIDEGFDSIE